MDRLEINKKKAHWVDEISNAIDYQIRWQDVNKKNANWSLKLDYVDTFIYKNLDEKDNCAVFFGVSYFDNGGDTEFHKKINANELLNGIKSGAVYVRNPSFFNKIFKQKWYREARNLI